MAVSRNNDNDQNSCYRRIGLRSTLMSEPQFSDFLVPNLLVISAGFVMEIGLSSAYG